jgi:hypothetical protein
VITNVSEEHIASIFRVEIIEAGGDRSSETLVATYKITRRHNPEDHNPPSVYSIPVEWETKFYTHKTTDVAVREERVFFFSTN